MRIFLLTLLLISRSAFALEVDEKLTVRILKTSETRKTLMVNRGTEDGIVEGDHAKFIVTAGIVARAVVIKVSPTRSVWSVYRLVNADYIVNDSVMTIKISPPVKITKDESQTLVQDDTPTTVATGDPAALGIPLADGAQDLNPAGGEDNLSQADLRALEESEPATIVSENKELFAILNISGLAAKTKSDTQDDTFNNSQSYTHISFGGEYYPERERAWYSHFSLQLMASLLRQHNQAYMGSSSTNDIMELSAGVNWHPTKLPSLINTFIPYFSLNASMGSAKSTYKPGQENPTGDEIEATGSTMGFSLGYGYKFYTRHGFGARAILDYYMRTEKYDEDEAQLKYNKTVSGPRFMVGLGYRF